MYIFYYVCDYYEIGSQHHYKHQLCVDCKYNSQQLKSLCAYLLGVYMSIGMEQSFSGELLCVRCDLNQVNVQV